MSLNYELIPPKGGILKLRLIAIPDTQQSWWRDWNTDNDSIKENSGKTLYLKRLGEKIIELLYSKEYELKSLDIKIVKK